MTKYIVEWTEEVYYRTEVEAENEQEAEFEFILGNYDEAVAFGSELQDSITVKEF